MVGSMSTQVKASPQEIEKGFNRICSEMNRYILRGDSRIPPKDLFKQLDDEFARVEKSYEEQNNEMNLLHATHNYLWRKSFQCLDDNPTRSLELVTEALSKLLDRNALRRYKAETFERMLGTYEVALIRIDQKSESVDYDKIDGKILAFLDAYFSRDMEVSEKFASVINLLIHLLVERGYDKQISELKVDYSEFDGIEQIVSGIKSALNIVRVTYRSKRSYLPSLCYELLYRIRKKQLHFLVNYMFFERSKKNKQRAQNTLDGITREMLDYTSKSLGYYGSYCRKLPAAKQEDPKVLLTFTLKELDQLNASYYEKAYSHKDVFGAWILMDKIRQLCVIKSFKEGVPLSDGLLEYFADEWSLLYVFAKIHLLGEEVDKRALSLSQEWETEIFSQIANSLELLKKLFKYETKDKRDYALKIMTSQFAGGFSEYFIHKLCQEFFDFGVVDEKSPHHFDELLECIKLARSKDDIILNDVVKPGHPDIDIHIKGKCAIFLKNARIESDEIKKIWKEIELCREEGVGRIFYGFNFIKNIQKIEFVRQSFEKMSKSFGDIGLDVFDIKDIVGVLIEELQRSGKSKLSFSELDLYKVLDY